MVNILECITLLLELLTNINNLQCILIAISTWNFIFVQIYLRIYFFFGKISLHLLAWCYNRFEVIYLYYDINVVI